MKVLLTGAFGNFGTTTLHSLLKQGHDVRCFDLETEANQKTAEKFENRIETIWGDVRNPDDLARAVPEMEVVIHLAFIVDMLRSDQQPEWAWEINVGGTKNLLDAMKDQSEPGKIIFASSINVFGHTQHLEPPRTLSDPVQPTSTYTHHKVECEELVKKSGLDWSVLRIAFSPPPNHEIQQLARAPVGVGLAELHHLLHDRCIRLPRTAARPAGALMKAALTVLLVPVDPLMGRLAGNAEAFGQLRNAVIVQLVVFEETLSLLAHGNTSPGHWALPPYGGEC